MSAPCSEKAKGPEPLGSSPFRWCEWGDLNSMGVVLCNHDGMKSLCLHGFAMMGNHMVRVGFRVSVTNLLPAACPDALCGICPRAERNVRNEVVQHGGPPGYSKILRTYSEIAPKRCVGLWIVGIPPLCRVLWRCLRVFQLRLLRNTPKLLRMVPNRRAG